MPRKQTLDDLGYRMRRRIVRGLRSRKSGDRWHATQSLIRQAKALRELAVYARFLSGESIGDITASEVGWTRVEIEGAIRRRGGVR